ncbi:protochlorophyllide reductase [Schumannella luteola]|uniref:NAD(P)-dependent dehydrogenase (Short-subunit alcohol dehydrogenase family) n=1 Tax=Schumannella luteola TaxID=472059 RepID=A0A852Y7V8_9MICO|nr:SDR family NAD(P)-dependent oxidoreductase [Schumannella luteola]NYG98453.1 NAD(P)-dependent dehydrogenase (short-subunit alcohol dehydrogenase family) [Schumannella luteola]TPX01316.1 SDR family NAD(P)-dependent oxidoreductase [Schumannella luteola]
MTTVLITGGHSGIGLAASRELARAGADLVLAGRSPERMQQVADELTADHGVTVALLRLDTSSLASVREAAAELGRWRETGAIAELDAVLCNAGGRYDGEVGYSTEGYELTFATNHLGNVLLVDLLRPHLSAMARVIVTASGTHDPESVDGRLVGAAVEPDAAVLAHIGRDGAAPLSAGKRYSTSKMCAVMYIYELDRRLRAEGSDVHAIAFDPGQVPETGFLRDMPRIVQRVATTSLFGWISKRIGGVVSDVGFSGGSLARLAIAPGYADRTGEYFQANDGVLSAVRSATLTYDRRRAAKLWDDSVDLIEQAVPGAMAPTR